jgi:hypothetical protein
LHYDFELANDFRWSQPFYDKGPFLSLLRASPEIGLETIIKLVNFTTDRWKECQEWRKTHEPESEWFPREKLILDVQIPCDDGEQTWIGDGRWFFAYRDMPQYPQVLTSALMALEKWLYDKLDKNEDIEGIIIDILGKTRSLALAGVLIGAVKKEPKLLLGALLPFLGMPEIYRFDFEHVSANEMHQMMGWGFGTTQEQFEAARDWHGMPHRKKQLEHVVFELLLRYPSFQEQMDEIRLRWQGVLRNNANIGIEDELLFRLYHQFDLNNWRCELNKDNNLRFEYKEPEEMQERNRHARQLHEDRQAIFYLPFKCRQIIDGQLEITQSEFDKLWERGEYLLSLDFDTIFGKEILISKQDIACGLIAAAVCKFRNCLNASGEDETEFLNILINITLNPPPRMQFDVPDSVGDTGWDSFCADALPILWADNKNAQEIRVGIGNLVLSFHYETVKRLFKNAFKIRKILDVDYQRLCHFMLRWSVFRYRLNLLSNNLTDQQSLDYKEIYEEINNLLKSFADGSISPDTPKWKSLGGVYEDKTIGFVEAKEKAQAMIYPNRNTEFLKKQKHIAMLRLPSIDLNLISYGYDHIVNLNDAYNESERTNWLVFFQQAVDTVSWMLHGGQSQIEEIDGMPYQFERWLFQKLPPIILSTISTSEAETLWHPILTLGSPAHYWISAFLNEWWNYGLSNHQHDTQYFLLIWKEMWEFTRTNPGWGNGAKRAWDMNKSYCSLIGLDELTLSFFWDATHIALVTSMRKEFSIWCQIHLADETCAGAFIRFLLKPAATPLLDDGIKWLDQTVTKHGFWYDYSKHIDGQLADLLDHCQELAKGENDIQAAFFRLLRVLVERQSPQALSLQDKLN